MKSYTFKVVLEKDKWPDETDEKAVWRAFIPSIKAAHAWGDTKQQALENLQNAVELILEDMLEQGKEIPQEFRQEVQVSEEPLLTVSV